MSGPSKIEWTEQTWNPIVGCSIVSPGCINCYAMKMAARIIAMAGTSKTGLHYDKTIKDVKGQPVWTGVVNMAPEHVLLAPLRRKKPTTYFVNSMGDLFHEDVPDEWIDKVEAVMALCPHHTFQVLTKRPARMRAYLSDPQRHNSIELAAEKIKRGPEQFGGKHVLPSLPLPNVWRGTSTERQKEADERIPELLQTPAAVRFVSAEPLIGDIDFTRLGDATMSLNAFTGDAMHLLGMKDKTLGKLNWVIVGGESGRNARRMQERWARDIRDQCEDADVPFFFKQWGEHDPETFDRVGKKAAGRLLDGIEHNAMPQRVMA